MFTNLPKIGDLESTTFNGKYIWDIMCHGHIVWVNSHDVIDRCHQRWWQMGKCSGKFAKIAQFFSGKWLQFSQVGWCLDLLVPRQIHRASQRADRWGSVWRGEPGQILSRRDYAIKKMSKGSTSIWQNAKLIGGLEHCFYFSIYWE